MKQHTDEAIKEFCINLWKEYMTWGADVEVERNEPEYVAIRVGAMYEPPSMNLNLLLQLAEFMGTKNINDDERFAESGCETCDYDSSYGFVLTIRPEKESA